MGIGPPCPDILTLPGGILAGKWGGCCTLAGTQGVITILKVAIVGEIQESRFQKKFKILFGLIETFNTKNKPCLI